MLNYDQRNTVYDAALAVELKQPDVITIDADPATGEGMDPVEDGVWVKAWVKVPKSVIPNYDYPQDFPTSRVEVLFVRQKEEKK